MITSGGQQSTISHVGMSGFFQNFIFNRNIFVLSSFVSMMSYGNNTISNVGQIIGLVIGVLSAIATLICCIMLVCYFWKNKNRNNVWAERSPPYYYQNRSYGQATTTPYYYQEPTTVTTNTYNEKY